MNIACCAAIYNIAAAGWKPQTPADLPVSMAKVGSCTLLDAELDNQHQILMW